VRRVLLVEDADDVREALAELLALHGHQIAAASRGEEGVALALRQEPEVVLVDIGLPDLDGHEVGRRLRAALGPAPLLIAMTGYGREEDRQRALQAGFDLHLVKPVDPDELERVVAAGKGC
jgi:two-component system, sensor histidine kinase